MKLLFRSVDSILAEFEVTHPQVSSIRRRFVALKSKGSARCRLDDGIRTNTFFRALDAIRNNTNYYEMQEKSRANSLL